MTDRLEGLTSVGIDPAARAASMTRVRRDERNEQERRGRPHEQPREQDEAGDEPDDGLPHVDVRA